MRTGELVLLTGGAGLLGASLARAALRAGLRVRVLDDFSGGSYDELRELDGAIELYEGDVLDRRLVRHAARGATALVHLADVDLATGLGRALEVGQCGLLATLEAAAAAGVQRVVYPSTLEVYGPAARFVVDEEQPPRPVTLDGAAKHLAERLCRRVDGARGAVVILRCSRLYGEAERGAPARPSAVARAVDALLSGEPPSPDPATPPTDFLLVDDAARAVLAALAAPPAALAGAGGIFNVASGEAYTEPEVTAAVLAAAGVGPPPPRPTAERAAARPRVATALARRALGWTALVPFADGVARTLHGRRARRRGEREHWLDRISARAAATAGAVADGVLEA